MISPATPIAALATRALRNALISTRKGLIISPTGYVSDPSENLLDGIRLPDIEADFRQGDGNELEEKFRAAHSSSALAANNFAPFKLRPGSLRLAGVSHLGAPTFEQKCPTGLLGTPPNLDLVAENDSAAVGVESKCTEFLRRHVAKFRPAYDDQIRDERRGDPWFAEMRRLVRNPASYVWLDAAQLVKHAFGLARAFRARRTFLLYLFWEPTNAFDFSVFNEHRREIEQLSERVVGAHPEFKAMSYRELWEEWERGDPPQWLLTHLGKVRARYDVAI